MNGYWMRFNVRLLSRIERVWDSIAVGSVCEIHGLLIAAEVFGIISLLKDLHCWKFEVRKINISCVYLIMKFTIILKKLE